jgi:hypothetical protein
MYEYHFHSLGTKKCHMPKLIDMALPIPTKTLSSGLMVINSAYNLQQAEHTWGRFRDTKNMLCRSASSATFYPASPAIVAGLYPEWRSCFSGHIARKGIVHPP